MTVAPKPLYVEVHLIINAALQADDVAVAERVESALKEDLSHKRIAKRDNVVVRVNIDRIDTLFNVATVYYKAEGYRPFSLLFLLEPVERALGGFGIALHSSGVRPLSG